MSDDLRKKVSCVEELRSMIPCSYDLLITDRLSGERGGAFKEKVRTRLSRFILNRQEYIDTERRTRDKKAKYNVPLEDQVAVLLYSRDMTDKTKVEEVVDQGIEEVLVRIYLPFARELYQSK